MEKKFTKFPDGDWTRDLPHGSKSRASPNVQGPLSRRVAERLHTVCKAQYLHEWQRGFTQCARPSVSMSGREASHSLNTHVAVSLVCANLGGPTQSGGSTRVVLLWRIQKNWPGRHNSSVGHLDLVGKINVRPENEIINHCGTSSDPRTRFGHCWRANRICAKESFTVKRFVYHFF